MSDPREEKLPVWARNLINSERHRANLAERRLAEYKETVEPTAIWYGDYTNPQFVPVDFGHQTLYFNMQPGPRQHSYDEIGVSYRSDHLWVSAGRGVLLKPQASNCFTVALDD